MRKKPLKAIDPTLDAFPTSQAPVDVLPPIDTPHRATNGKKLPTAKQKRFAKEYAKTLNGVQSAMKVYDTDDPNTANQIAIDNLRKPIVRMEIERLLQNNDVNLSEIISIHKRNMLQNKHYPTSQKAVSDFYEILGLKNQDKPTTDVKIAFVIEK